MAPPFTFITHPNVVIDPRTPVPEWPLSEVGQRRMRAGLAQPWVASVTRIFCSAERKAIDGAQILAEHLGLSYTVEAALGENDRSSTGFLPAAQFEAMADRFFAEPELSAEGWERAVDAQARIARAVEWIAAQVGADDRVAIVSHGAVGTLLYCRLAGLPISRRWDQPANGGGNYFAFDLDPPCVHSHWLPLDGDVLPFLAARHGFRLPPPAPADAIERARTELRLPDDLCALYAIANGLSHGWFKLLPLHDPARIGKTWDSLQRANDPAHSRWLRGEDELLREFLVVAELSGPDFAAIRRSDGTIWFSESDDLHQTHLDLLGFVETCLREVDEL